jgi:hypothetical protein
MKRCAASAQLGRDSACMPSARLALLFLAVAAALTPAASIPPPASFRLPEATFSSLVATPADVLHWLRAATDAAAAGQQLLFQRCRCDKHNRSSASSLLIQLHRAAPGCQHTSIRGAGSQSHHHEVERAGRGAADQQLGSRLAAGGDVVPSGVLRLCGSFVTYISSRSTLPHEARQVPPGQCVPRAEAGLSRCGLLPPLRCPQPQRSAVLE